MFDRRNSIRVAIQAWFFVSASVLAPPHASGQAMFSEGRTIDAPRLHDLAIVDVDGDGDPDLVAIAAEGSYANSIVWFENNGAGNFAPTQTLLASLPPQTRALKTADLNGDGTPDLLFGNDALFGFGGLFWTANEGGRFNALQVIEPTESGHFVAVDFDGDGDLDVLQGGLYVGLYENTGADSSRFRRSHAIAPGPTGVFTAGDFDGDGDADLISSHRGYERNNDVVQYYAQREPGRLSFSPRHELMSFVREQPMYDRLISGMALADIDGDGRQDVVIGAYLNTDVGHEMGRLTWYKNYSFLDNPVFRIGGAIAYNQQGVGEPWGPSALTIGDVDGDGDNDVAITKAKSGADTLVWYENSGDDVESSGLWPEHAVDVALHGMEPSGTVDIDLDGNVDLLFFSSTRIVWYENLGRIGTGTDQPQRLAVVGPESLTLEAIWSNPSYGIVNVAYQVSRAGRVRFEVFDVLGRQVSTYEDNPPNAGSHRAELDLSALARGTYLVRIRGNGGDVTGTLVLQ